MGRINESKSQYLMFHDPQPCSKVLSSPSEVVQWKTTALYFGIIEGIIFDIMIHLAICDSFRNLRAHRQASVPLS